MYVAGGFGSTRFGREHVADRRKVEKQMARPRPALGETRERVLDVAEELFAARGLAGTSMRDIATKAGLKAASLYNHFSGKQALYEAVLRRGVEPLIEILGDLARPYCGKKMVEISD